MGGKKLLNEQWVGKNKIKNMAFYSEIKNREQKFIKSQKIFFVATAPKDGRINLSPKGMDTFRVINKNRVLWLNLTGSGNETAAHLLDNNKITIMFCAFEGNPTILRLYGKGVAIHPKDNKWNDTISLFPEIPGARQIFDIQIESVQTSCGMAVPYFNFVDHRNQLKDHAKKTGQKEIEQYWKDRNSISIDGLPTEI